MFFQLRECTGISWNPKRTNAKSCTWDEPTSLNLHTQGTGCLWNCPAAKALSILGTGGWWTLSWTMTKSSPIDWGNQADRGFSFTRLSLDQSGTFYLAVGLCHNEVVDKKKFKTLTFFDSVNMNSSTSFVNTSSGRVFSFVERNLMALSLTISSPWRIWLNKPPKVPEWRINQVTQIILKVWSRAFNTLESNFLLQDSTKYFKIIFTSFDKRNCILLLVCIFQMLSYWEFRYHLQNKPMSMSLTLALY